MLSDVGMILFRLSIFVYVDQCASFAELDSNKPPVVTARVPLPMHVADQSVKKGGVVHQQTTNINSEGGTGSSDSVCYCGT